MGGFFGTSLHLISTGPESHSPTRNAHQIAEAFLPRTMAAADASNNPTRLSATPARVRAQWQMKEKTKKPRKPEKEKRRDSARLSLSLQKMTKIPTRDSSLGLKRCEARKPTNGFSIWNFLPYSHKRQFFFRNHGANFEPGKHTGPHGRHGDAHAPGVRPL